jgi:hypothetical protein
MSASHVAMASIRMESGYVVMGEAAGVAASHACRSGQPVQDVDIDEIRDDLKNAGVVMHWNGTRYGPDKSWADYLPIAQAFASREEWNLAQLESTRSSTLTGPIR